MGRPGSTAGLPDASFSSSSPGRESGASRTAELTCSRAPVSNAATRRPRHVQATEAASSSSDKQQQGQTLEELPIWVRREKERELQASSRGPLGLSTCCSVSWLHCIGEVTAYDALWQNTAHVQMAAASSSSGGSIRAVKSGNKGGLFV